MKVTNESFIQAPWGKIAIKTWGHPSNPPVLLVHGSLDSLATFVPLVDLLPDTYYYVAMDLPGHGLSDAFPIGICLSRFHMVAPIDIVVKHFGWSQFVYVGHSLAGELGYFYNAVRPNKISRMIQLDSNGALQSLLDEVNPKMYQQFYGNYYDNYHKFNHDERMFTKKRAVQAVMKVRKLSQEQAELILSRNLKRVGEDQYKLSTDRRLRVFSQAFSFFPLDYIKPLFQTIPPTLLISATDQKVMSQIGITAEKANKIFEFLKSLDNFTAVTVEGKHDVHFTHPELVNKVIEEFLRPYSKSKL